MIPQCQLQSGAMRQWHDPDGMGKCRACGTQLSGSWPGGREGAADARAEATAARPRVQGTAPKRSAAPSLPDPKFVTRALPAQKDDEIRKRLAEGVPIKRVAREVGVAQGTVRARARAAGQVAPGMRATVTVPAVAAPLNPVALVRIDSTSGEHGPADREPSEQELQLVAAEAERARRSAERLLLAHRVPGKAPDHYVRIAADLLGEAGARPSGARTKVLAAVVAVLLWNDAWADDGLANDVLDPLKVDPQDVALSMISDAGEAIMGKETERPWLHPRKKGKAG